MVVMERRTQERSAFNTRDVLEGLVWHWDRGVRVPLKDCFSRWMDEIHQLKSSPLVSFNQSLVDVVITKTIADDHQSCVWLREIFFELGVVPTQYRMALHRADFIPTDNQERAAI